MISIAMVAVFLGACSSDTDSEPTIPQGWSDIAPIGAGSRQQAAVAVVNDEVYLIGGVTDTGTPSPPAFSETVTDRLEKYNPKTDTWTTLAPMPLAANTLNAAVVNNKIYVVGGLVTRTPDDAELDYPWFASPKVTFVYDPATDKWSDIADMPAGTERGESAIGVHENKIYVAGGLRCLDGFHGECSPENGGVTAQPQFSVYDTENDTWTSLPDLPDGGRASFEGTFYGDKFYTFGGRIVTSGPPYGEVLSYDLTNKTWSTVSSLPTPRSTVIGALVGTKYYVMGGECNEPTPTAACSQADQVTESYNNNEVYDFATGTWTILNRMPVSLHGTEAGVVNGVIYIPGGATSTTLNLSNANRRFNP